MARPAAAVTFTDAEQAAWPVWAEPQNRFWATADTLLDTYDTLAMVGGNRSSKTRWGLSRVVRACLGAYAWCPLPASCAIISLSKDQGSSAFQEYIEAYVHSLPKGMVLRQTTREELTNPIRFSNGSVIHVKTIKMGAARIQGGGYNLVLVDEEDGQLRRIHKELVARARADVPLKIVFTAAPTQGLTYLYREIIAKAEAKQVAVLPVSVFENAHGVCRTCHTPREAWDARLPALKLARNSWHHEALGALCPRCYTFGEEPRIQPSVIARWNQEYTTRAERGIRFYGEWPTEGGVQCFSPKQMNALRAGMRPVLRREGPVTYWAEPEAGHAYGAAVDVAHGTDRDETVHGIVDVASREQVCLWGDARAEPTAYINDILEVSAEFGHPRHWVENIGGGIYIIDELLAAGVPVYKHRSPTRRTKASPRMEVGARPGLRNREAILERMVTAVKKGLRELCPCHAQETCPEGASEREWAVVRGDPGAIYVNDPGTLDQLERLQWPHEEQTRIDVDEGHDDRVMWLAGAVEVLRDPAGSGVARPRPKAKPKREDRYDPVTKPPPSRWAGILGTHDYGRRRYGVA